MIPRTLAAVALALALAACGATTHGDLDDDLRDAQEAAAEAAAAEERAEERRHQEWLDESRRQRVLTCVLLDELGRDVVWDAEVDACSDLTPTTTTTPGG